MNIFRCFSWFALLAISTVCTSALGQQVTVQRPANDQEGLEVLTRGPVHEAFAETITFDPEPGIVIPTAPPDPIDEIAPDRRPEGANVTWIPGYWGWDDERKDFVWISGIWRALPPGRQWIPGYWGQTQQGSQWVSGYWADAAATEIDYLPEPPASVETGPNVEAPSAESTWLPGCWIWQQNRYAWRHGTWTAGNQNWDWVPDHYVWTPSGYIFVDGYHDYSVPRRGVVFAPVFFSRGLRTQAGYAYSPMAAINPGVFARHLFLRSGYGHYYFGDYYGSNYADAGYLPGFSYQSSRRGYDPIYAHQRWQHRHDRDWEQRVRSSFRNFRDNDDARPPRNWAAQRELARRDASKNQGDIAVALPLDELSRRQIGKTRFQPVDPAERQQLGQRGQQYRQYLQRRQQLEADAARTADGTSSVVPGPARRKVAKSPFVAPPADQLGKQYAPPQRHQVLKPDFQVQPQPRANRGKSGLRQAQAPANLSEPARQSQGQPQRQNINRGNRPGASAPKSRPQGGQGENRGNRQARSGGNRQGGAGGQNQDQQQNQPAKQAKEQK